MDVNVKDLLKHRLEDNKPTLFLGAGFSFGAKNSQGNSINVGTVLAKSLFTHFYIDNPPQNKDKNYISRVEKEQENLKYLCDLMRSEGRVSERNKFLTKMFTGCNPDTSSFQYLVTKYPWEKIFTLNIDDLIENIYEDQKVQLRKWNFSDHGYSNREKNQTLLIKLHGDVSSPDDGYIFDNDEYSQYSSKGSCLLNEFADAYTHGDVIFVGTEFQEQDLLDIINKYKHIGYKNAGHHYFFVTPHINNLSLVNMLQSEEFPYMHWVEMDAETFFKYVHKEIVINLEKRHLLTTKGAIFLDEIGADISVHYHSDLYTGSEPLLDDFFENWDIIYPNFKNIFNKLLRAESHGIFAIYGESYVGKTCVAMRTLVDFMKEGYIAIQITLCTPTILDLLYEYLRTLPKGSKVSILFENASFYYDKLTVLLDSYDLASLIVVMITVDLKINFQSKSHVLFDTKYCTEFFVEEKINRVFASNIFDKLIEKGRLGELNKHLGYPSNTQNPWSKNQVIRYIMGIDDIVEVLYYAEEGRGFQGHFSDLLKNKIESRYYKYFCILVKFGVLGIDNFPIRILSELLQLNFDTEMFHNEFSDVVSIKDGRAKVRCLRIIQKSINCTLLKDEILFALKQITHQTIGQFKEGEINESCELFQKALSVKKLEKYNILSKIEIYDLLSSLITETPKINLISYFWIQLGISAQTNNQFEEANSYLLNAQRIRRNSYQVEHALAKNWMERGLYEIQNDDIFNGNDHFQKGKSMMQVLIFNGRYSKALRYSVHTYVDMLLKYNKDNNSMKEDEYIYITDLLKSQCLSSDNDSYIRSITERFIGFCNQHGQTKFVVELRNCLNIKSRYTSEDEYDVDSWLGNK